MMVEYFVDAENIEKEKHRYMWLVKNAMHSDAVRGLFTTIDFPAQSFLRQQFGVLVSRLSDIPTEHRKVAFGMTCEIFAGMPYWQASMLYDWLPIDETEAVKYIRKQYFF